MPERVRERATALTAAAELGERPLAISAGDERRYLACAEVKPLCSINAS